MGSNKILLILIFLLIIAILPLPYGYYIFLRFIVFISSIILIYKLYHRENNISGYTIIVFIIIVLYNPIIPVYLNKLMWIPINLATALFFYQIYKLKYLKYSDLSVNKNFNGYGNETYENGTMKYQGEFQDGERHGYGIFIWKDGKRYEGNFSKGLKSGYGILTWPSGDKYEGEFKNGVRDGFGIMHYPSGNKYKGEFKNDKSSKGELFDTSGDKYVGDFVDNKPWDVVQYNKLGEKVNEWVEGKIKNY